MLDMNDNKKQNRDYALNVGKHFYYFKPQKHGVYNFILNQYNNNYI